MSEKSSGKATGTFNKLLSCPKSLLKRFSSLSRNTKLAVVLISLLALAGLWSITFQRNVTDEQQQASDEEAIVIENSPAMPAKLNYIQGVVEFRNEQGEWSEAKIDSDIKQNTALKTIGASSRAIVELEDGSVIRIDANSEISFETLTQNRVLVEQSSGYLYNRLSSTGTRIYIVRTENAQFQSLGTAFRTSASGDEEAVEVFFSEVKETESNISVKEGDKLIAKSNINPSKDNTNERMDIEKIKKDAFIVWNRDLDLKDDNFKNEMGFLKDFNGPEISINQPTSGSTIQVPAGERYGKVILIGKTEAGAKLTAQSKSISGSPAVDIKVESDGSFESQELEASVGNSVFELIATDRVGNKTTLNVSYRFVKESNVQESSISLTSTQTVDKIQFSWTLSGMTTPNGVWLVGDTQGSTYPGSVFSQQVTTGGSAEIDKTTYIVGNKYYFRVCRYILSTDSCDIYSNQVEITITP